MRLVDDDKSGDFQFNILLALQRKTMYLGTVSPAEKARRRAKDKVAKASRKRNRGR